MVKLSLALFPFPSRVCVMVCVCVQNKAPDTMKKASHNEDTHDIICIYIYMNDICTH